jgi:hypothetical protein
MLSVRNEWSVLEQELIAALPGIVVPAAPWSPVPWMTIHDPGLFVRRLSEDVGQGSNGPRSKTGAILYDLLLVNGRTGELNTRIDAGCSCVFEAHGMGGPEVQVDERLTAERIVYSKPAEDTKKTEPPVRELRSRLIPYPF